VQVLWGQVEAIPVVDQDQLGLGQREVELPADEAEQRLRRGGGRLPDALPAVAQGVADPDQQRRQHRVLAGEVPVDGGAADPGRAADVLEADAEVAVLGDEALGRGQQRLPPVGLELLARGQGRLTHTEILWTFQLMTTNLNSVNHR
jgi:hypothetical protein